MADLIRCLSGAQTNNNGWPTFKGKYVEYPRFRKEWWAYRRTYSTIDMYEMNWFVETLKRRA
jgi:hypothetical protein